MVFLENKTNKNTPVSFLWFPCLHPSFFTIQSKTKGGNQSLTTFQKQSSVHMEGRADKSCVDILSLGLLDQHSFSERSVRKSMDHTGNRWDLWKVDQRLIFSCIFQISTKILLPFITRNNKLHFNKEITFFESESIHWF